MKPYLVKTPKFIQRLFPKRTWALPASKQSVYLTFDDGPIPEVTPWVLDLLKRHEARTTFFCIGENIKKHPDLFHRIISEGHTVGNHTFNHLNGRKTQTEKYIDNVLKAEVQIQAELKIGRLKSEDIDRPSNIDPPQSLFRPPYGKMTGHQATRLRNMGYQIIMWDVLSADFDTTISEKECLGNVLGAISPGSIVVFHDSLKARKNIEFALPKVLEYIFEKGWKCEPIMD